MSDSEKKCSYWPQCCGLRNCVLFNKESNQLRLRKNVRNSVIQICLYFNFQREKSLSSSNQKRGCRCKIDEKSSLSWTNEKSPGFLSFMEGSGNEKGVRAFTELLRRSYSFILYQWWDSVGILQQPLHKTLFFITGNFLQKRLGCLLRKILCRWILDPLLQLFFRVFALRQHIAGFPG